MTEPGFASRWSSPEMQEHLRRRYRAERRFRALGLGRDRDRPHGARDPAREHHREGLVGVRAHGAAARRAARRVARRRCPRARTRPRASRRSTPRTGRRRCARPCCASFPEVTERSQVRELAALVSTGARTQLRERVARDPSLLGTQRLALAPGGRRGRPGREGDRAAGAARRLAAPERRSARLAGDARGRGTRAPDVEHHLPHRGRLAGARAGRASGEPWSARCSR